MMWVVKLHKSEEGNILVVSDEELVGEKFEEKGRQLDLDSDFYKGERKDEEEIKKLIQKLDFKILHLTGKRTINLFKDWIDKEKILKVEGVLHAEVYLEKES